MVMLFIDTLNPKPISMSLVVLYYTVYLSLGVIEHELNSRSIYISSYLVQLCNICVRYPMLTLTIVHLRDNVILRRIQLSHINFALINIISWSISEV